MDRETMKGLVLQTSGFIHFIGTRCEHTQDVNEIALQRMDELAVLVGNSAILSEARKQVASENYIDASYKLQALDITNVA